MKGDKMEDYLTLSNDEKKSMIRSHLKTIQHSKYNVELYILQEQAAGMNDGAPSVSYQEQLNGLVAREAALLEELQNLETL